MDWPRLHQMEWINSEREKQMSYINVYMWNPRKWYKWKYLASRNGIPWTEEPGGALQSVGSQRVRHDWSGWERNTHSGETQTQGGKMRVVWTGRLGFPYIHYPCQIDGLPQWFSGKESACSAGDAGDSGSIPGLGGSPGEGYGNPIQYSCLENLHTKETGGLHRVT